MADAAAMLATAQKLLESTTLGEYLATRPPSTVVTISDAMPLEQVWVWRLGPWWHGWAEGGGWCLAGPVAGMDVAPAAHNPPHPVPRRWQVLKIFAVRNILSAPVFAAGSSRCLGFVGVDDVTRAVLGWADVGADPSPSGRAEGLRRAGERLARERVRDIARANDGELVVRASEACTLLQVRVEEGKGWREVEEVGEGWNGVGRMHTGLGGRPCNPQLSPPPPPPVRSGFLRGGRGPPCHRVAVYDFEGVEESESGGWGGCGDGDGGDSESVSAGGSSRALKPTIDPTEIRILAIVSQSDVISFLAKHVDRLGPLAATPVADTGAVTSPVVAVPDSMPAAMAFASMFAKGAPVSSAAVLASRGPDAGTLIANISVSDLRGLRPAGLAALAAPVLTFLRTKAAPGAGSGEAAAAWGVRAGDSEADVRPVSVPPGAPLGEVLRLLDEGRRHRVYVCDASGRPDGIVTLTDLLRLFARRAE